MRKIIFLIIICILFLSGCNIPNMMDLELNNETELYSGHNDLCENPYIKTECKEGLECRRITTKPHITKVCLYPNEEIKEDLTYRNPYEDNKEYVLTKDLVAREALENSTETTE